MKNENIRADEIYLASSMELFEEAGEIALNTQTEEKYSFILQYNANQREFMQSILETVGAIVNNDNLEECLLSVMMNMTQLAFIKCLDCVERVKTDEVHNPYLIEDEVNDIDDQMIVEGSTSHVGMTTNDVQVMSLASEELGQDEVATTASYATSATSADCPCSTNTSMSTAKVISDEGSVGGYICCPCTEQWFKFTATRTGQYTIGSTGSKDTIGTLYDDNGNKIAENDDFAPSGKTNFRIVIDLAAGNTYYVKVRLHGNATGRYTLRVTERLYVNYVRINMDRITLLKGVTYELPITPFYVYKGYNGAQPISGLDVSIIPSNADEQKIWWYSQSNDVFTILHGSDEDGNRYAHLVVTGVGDAKLYAQDWKGNGKCDECTVAVAYCGGNNYRDVTQHSLELQNDGYYVCSKCGYRIKSPKLQDKEILSDEDYYKVLSCYMSIPYYAKIDGVDEGNYSIKATALHLIIDDIRSKSQYSHDYEYVGSDGVYKREYTIGKENDDYNMPVTINYNTIDDGLELILNNGVASGIVELLTGWLIPMDYQFLFFDLADTCTNLTDFLCNLADSVGYKEISIILKLILIGATINEIDEKQMKVTDKVVKIQFTVGAGVYVTKTVFDSNGNLKFQENSVL